MQILIRQANTDEYPAIHELLLAAFGQAYEAQLVENIRQREDFQPEWSMAAVGNQEVVMGYVLLTPITVAGATVNGLGLGPLAVHPAYQGRYIGSALMWQAIERCQKRGIDFVVILGDPKYYSRFEFISAASKGLHCQWDVPADVFQVRELRAGALDDIQGLVQYLPEF